MSRARLHDLDHRSPPEDAAACGCAFPGCAEKGDFRAPRTREPRDGYHRFCLDHVRQYNAAWDFFSGMSAEEVERYQRESVTWHRPTWRLGARPEDGAFFSWVQDDLGLLSEIGIDLANGRVKAKAPPPADPEERRALAALDLEPGLSLQQIKTRYKELAKRYHPDANGGDRGAEERLKVINRAYNYLMSCGYT